MRKARLNKRQRPEPESEHLAIEVMLMAIVCFKVNTGIMYVRATC